MIVKLLSEHHLVFLSLKGGCTGSSESTHIKMPHCWLSILSPNICDKDRWSLGSRLWCPTVSLSLSHWYPGSVVVLEVDCIDS